MTDLDRWIQRINDSSVSQAEKQRLRQLARSLANANGDLGPSDRDRLQRELASAQGGGGNQGGGGGNNRPAKPGAAWVWSDIENRWVKPGKPGFDSSQGNYTWDDNQGWVWQANGGGGGGNRPPQPGSAWVWSPSQNAWVRPPMPNRPPGSYGDGNFQWDDNRGWVWTSRNPETGELNPITPVDPTNPNPTNPVPTDPVPTDPTNPTNPTNPTQPSGPDPFEEWQRAQEQERRTSASAFFRGLLGQFGFTAGDTDALMSMFDNWLAEGFNDEAIMMKFRGTDIYTKRFPGMQALVQRGQAITEAEYIRLESSYRGVLSSYGLPKEFYDSPDDYGKFIANNVSPDEVDERASTGVRILQSADRKILDELGEYYGVTQGTALAYLLDADKAQDLIRRQVRAATIGASGERFGFNMQRTYSENLGATSLGQTIDGMSPEAAARLDQSFTTARRVADRERVLANIDSETFKDLDAVDAMFGDLGKQLASQARAKRERARFMGTAGIGSSSLSQERNL